MAYVVTLVADRTATSLTPATMARVRDALRGAMPVVLSENEAADIPTRHEPDMEAVRAALENDAIDAIPVRSRGRRKGLLIADMDCTIITVETLDEIAVFAGIGEKIAAITARAMNGEIAFEDALRGQGYMHAQERFFEMDLLRRLPAGELAALLGERDPFQRRGPRAKAEHHTDSDVLDRLAAIEAYARNGMRDSAVGEFGQIVLGPTKILGVLGEADVAVLGPSAAAVL